MKNEKNNYKKVVTSKDSPYICTACDSTVDVIWHSPQEVEGERWLCEDCMKSKGYSMEEPKKEMTDVEFLEVCFNLPAVERVNFNIDM